MLNFSTELVYLGFENRIAMWQGGLKKGDTNTEMLGWVRTSFDVSSKTITFNMEDVLALYVKYPKLSNVWEAFLIEYYNKLPGEFVWEKYK